MHLTLACVFSIYKLKYLLSALNVLWLRYIEERSFRRFVEACLEETVVVYVDHLLTQVFVEKNF